MGDLGPKVLFYFILILLNHTFENVKRKKFTKFTVIFLNLVDFNFFLNFNYYE